MIVLENQIINYIGLGSRADFSYFGGTLANYQIHISGKTFNTGNKATVRLRNQVNGTVLKEWICDIPNVDYILWTIAAADLVSYKALNYFVEATYLGEMLFTGNFELMGSAVPEGAIEYPVNTSLPYTTTATRVGLNIEVENDGTWTGTPPITFTYQWLLDGADIVGETQDIMAILPEYLGKLLSVRVTATNAFGSNSATSTPVGPVTNPIVTLAELNVLISLSQLIPGVSYEITGVDVPLYGGTTIILQAFTENTVSLSGHGLFYNPKYDLSVEGSRIWSPYVMGEMTNKVNTFELDEPVTSDNGATGIYKCDTVIEYVDGDWGSASSFTGDNTGATSDLALFFFQAANPIYNIGDRVVWGGKHWDNVTGLVGSSIDMFTLDANWQVVPFNSTDYNVSIDTISYDLAHDLIIHRADVSNNSVSASYGAYVNFTERPIKVFQWGREYNTLSGESTVGNIVEDSYFECLNAQGIVTYNRVSGLSLIRSNTILPYSGFSFNLLDNSATISDNILAYSASFNYNEVLLSGSIYGNVGPQQLTNNVVSYSSINGNIFDVIGYLGNNKLESGSSIADNEIKNNAGGSGGITSNICFGGGLITGNVLTEGGLIQDNQLLVGSEINDNIVETATNKILGNQLLGSKILNVSLLTGASEASLYNNNFLQSNFTNTTFTRAIMIGAKFSGSVISFTGIPQAKSITRLEVVNVVANLNVASATHLYNGSYPVKLYTNAGSGVRLGYYNASDIWTAVNPNS